MSWNEIKILFLSPIWAILFFACESTEYKGETLLPGAVNLVGEYEGAAFGGILNETWKMEPSGSVIQVGYYIEAGDTLSTQTVKFERINDKIYLIALVEERPPLIFEGVHVSDDKVIFENMNNSNPFRIEYTFLENEYRRVTTGTENGEESINRYHLIRK